MTVTDTTTWQACRHCRARIRPSAPGAHWIDADNYDHCKDTGNSHEPASACRVVDLRLTWGAILEGDLVIHGGRYEEVRHTTPTPGKLRIAFRDPTVPMIRVGLDNLVAVRRYISEETP